MSVLVIGDSVVAGNVSGGGIGWVASLASMYPSIPFANYAVGGSSSQSWSPTWSWLNERGCPPVDRVDDGEPIAIIGLGGNDALGASEANLEPNSGYEFHLAMCDIVEYLLEQIDRTVIIVAPVEQANYTSGNQAKFNARVRELRRWCERRWWSPERVMYAIPTLTTAHYNGFDVHPNQAGHDEIRDCVKLTLDRALCRYGG